MDILVSKYSKGLYSVSVQTYPHHQSAPNWTVFLSLWNYLEHKDLREALGMNKVIGDMAKFVFLTNKENLEIVIAVMEDFKYYDLQPLRDILSLMK